MKPILISLLLFITPAFAQSETPSQALEAFIALYQARDFETLVVERYAELHKAGSAEEIQILIARFSETFASDDRQAQAIALYEQALKLTPQITSNPTPQPGETSTMAVYDLGDSVLQLYLLESGKWGFHL